MERRYLDDNDLMLVPDPYGYPSPNKDSRPRRYNKVEYQPWMAMAERDQKRRLGNLGVEPWADRTVENYLKIRNNAVDSYNHMRRLEEFDRDYEEKKEKARLAELAEIQRKEDEKSEKISRALYRIERKVQHDLKYKKIVEDVFRRNNYDLAELKGRRPYVALTCIRRKIKGYLTGATHYLEMYKSEVKWLTMVAEKKRRAMETKLKYRPNQKFEEKLHNFELDLEWPLMQTKMVEANRSSIKTLYYLLENEINSFPCKIWDLKFAGGRLKRIRRSRHYPLNLSERYRVPAEEIPYVDRLSSFLEQAKLGAVVTTSVMPVPRSIRIYRERKKLKQLNLDPRITRLPKSDKERIEMERELHMKDLKHVMWLFRVHHPDQLGYEAARQMDMCRAMVKNQKFCDDKCEMDKFQYYMYGEQEMYELLDIENNEVRPPEYKHTPAPDYFRKRVDPAEKKRKEAEEKKLAKEKFTFGCTMHCFRRNIFKMEKILGIRPTIGKPNDLTLDEVCDKMETTCDEFLQKSFVGRNIGHLLKRFSADEEKVLSFERRENEREAARKGYPCTFKTPRGYPYGRAKCEPEKRTIIDDYLDDGYETPHEMIGTSDEEDEPFAKKRTMKEFLEERRKEKYTTPKYNSNLEVRKTDPPIIRKVMKEVPTLAEMRKQIIEERYYKRKHFT